MLKSNDTVLDDGEQYNSAFCASGPTGATGTAVRHARRLYSATKFLEGLEEARFVASCEANAEALEVLGVLLNFWQERVALHAAEYAAAKAWADRATRKDIPC